MLKKQLLLVLSALLLTTTGCDQDTYITQPVVVTLKNQELVSEAINLTANISKNTQPLQTLDTTADNTTEINSTCVKPDVCTIIGTESHIAASSNTISETTIDLEKLTSPDYADYDLTFTGTVHVKIERSLDSKSIKLHILTVDNHLQATYNDKSFSISFNFNMNLDFKVQNEFVYSNSIDYSGYYWVNNEYTDFTETHFDTKNLLYLFSPVFD